MKLQDAGGPGRPATTEASAGQGRAPQKPVEGAHPSRKLPVGLQASRTAGGKICGPLKKLLFLKPPSVTPE